MVKYYTCLMLVLLWSISLYSHAGKTGDTVILSTNDKHIQYGKYFNLYLKINKNTKIDITSFLQPLKYFVRFKIVNTTDNTTYTTYKIKATALRSGRIKIPALKWGRVSTQAFDINVTPALSSTDQPILIKYAKSNPSPWEREQVIISVSLITNDTDVILSTKNIVQEGINSYQLKHSTTMLDKNGEIKYSHTIGWAVYFLYSKTTNIELPAIEYLKNSVPRYKFNFKDLDFTVKKLPIYISPTTPIGKIKLKAKYIDIRKPFMQPKSTSIIQYTLTGTGIPAKWLPSISQLYNLNSQDNIQYSHLETSLQTSKGIENIYGKKTVDIAFTPTGNGFTPFQNINLQYFNPESNKLETLNFEHEKLLALNWFFQSILFLFAVYITYKILVVIIKLSRGFVFRKKHQYLFLKAIHAATSINDIKISLKLFSRAEQWPSNISINNWLQRYKRKYYATNKIENTFITINNELYSKQKITGNKNILKQIKEVIYGEIKNRRKLPHKNKFNLTYLSRYFLI